MARQRTSYGRAERELLGDYSWQSSPSSHQWQRRSRSARSGRMHGRSSGCLTSGWSDRMEISTEVLGWIRQTIQAVVGMNRGMQLHESALGRRIERGDRVTTPVHVPMLGTIVIATWCHQSGELRTTIHGKAGV